MNIKVSYTPNCNRSRLKGILKSIEETNKRILRYSESMREEADVFVIQIDDSFENLQRYTKYISKGIPGTLFIVVGDYWKIYYKGEEVSLVSVIPLIKEV